MFTFQQFCERSVIHSDGRVGSHFLLEKELIQYLTKEELELVHLDYHYTKIHGNVYVWYPKTRWIDRPTNKNELKTLLRKAIDNDDWNEVTRIQTKMKEFK